ncbi:YhjD/YihY/BrkB family envelope integrity protein [Sphingomonas aerolata]|uniref:YhjD/YihY/BrkB family envelope integrity protein n=1 Tax=Sphingomonas aerolata TaxID=185951 RepID=UPI003A5C3B85
MPLLASIVLIYGLVADTATVVANIRGLFQVLPADAAKVIGDQLATVVGTSEGKKGFGLILHSRCALAVRRRASSIVTALNIAHEERETRGFFALYILAFSITAGAVVLALTAALSTAAFALLDSMIPRLPISS